MGGVMPKLQDEDAQIVYEVAQEFREGPLMEGQPLFEVLCEGLTERARLVRGEKRCCRIISVARGASSVSQFC
jgi:hypothetical protein